MDDPEKEQSMRKTSARVLAATVLIAGVAVAQQPAHAGNGKSAVGKLPKDTAMVLTINVDRAKKSGLFKDAMTMAKKDPDMAKGIDMLKAQADFDIRKHVKTLTVGFAKDFDKTEETVILVEGIFNPKKFVNFAKASATSVVEKKHAGVKYWQINNESEMALLKNFMVITKKGAMQGVINVHKGKAANAKRNAQLMKMMKGTDTSKDAWFVGVLPDTLRNQAKGMLGGATVDGVAASVDIKAGLDAKLRVVASTAAAAQALSGLMTMGVKQGANDPSVQAMGLGPALNKVTIKSKANNVDVGIKLSKPELDKIKNILKSFVP